MPEQGFSNGPGEQSRPYALGYGIPRGRDGMLPWRFVDGRMAASLNYWVATPRPDGRPHVVPVWGLWVDGTFYFGGEPMAGGNEGYYAVRPSVVLAWSEGGFPRTATRWVFG